MGYCEDCRFTRGMYSKTQPFPCYNGIRRGEHPDQMTEVKWGKDENGKPVFVPTGKKAGCSSWEKE